MLWDNAKVEQLIALVLERPALWNKSLDAHKNSNILSTKWDEIALQFESTKKQVQNKWRALKKTYNRELDRLPVLRSGAGGSDNEKSDWPHFQAMQFTSGNLRTRPGTGNLSDASSDEEDIIETPPQKTKSAKTTRHQPGIIDEVVYEPNAIDMSEDKADWFFFLSLLPEIRKINGTPKKLEFRIKFTQLIHDYLDKSIIQSSKDNDDVQVIDCKMGSQRRTYEEN